MKVRGLKNEGNKNTVASIDFRRGRATQTRAHKRRLGILRGGARYPFHNTTRSLQQIIPSYGFGTDRYQQDRGHGLRLPWINFC